MLHLSPAYSTDLKQPGAAQRGVMPAPAPTPVAPNDDDDDDGDDGGSGGCGGGGSGGGVV